jgi:acetylornithine deacetylase/succinyl-diaminopimelate desuccinylase-like protein
MSPLDDLFEFLRFPSVSADSKFRSAVESCADWLTSRLKNTGLDAQKFATPGNPVVVARNEPVPGGKTLLIYGHYDVQPPDPLDLWHSPPFEPVIVDGRIVARGSTDNKGQILAHILGVEAALRAHNKLPVNLIFVVEGEEETGSAHLEAFLREHRATLQPDIIVVSDTGMFAPGVPTFTYGLRGILCLELRLQGPNVDLHSGIFGGSVENPATVLSQMIAALHRADGSVAIPRFYDRVKAVEPWEKELWNQLSFDDQAWLANTGARGLSGENGYTTLERIWARPTAEVNGLLSGYQGEGSKTIVPSRAIGKLSFRLVPDQDPDQLRPLIEEFLRSRCPESVTLEIVPQHAGKPYLVDIDSPFAEAAKNALHATFTKPIAFIREGGSIPITQTFKDVFGIDTLLLGLALPDARAHSPNENFPVENFHAGIRLNQNLLEQLAHTP